MIAAFLLGIYLIQKTASIIEHTTGVLRHRTGLAGGLLQSLGTAFPDMVIGIVSAVMSLQAAATNYLQAVNLAIIAASATFGSNIYNILHATWCIWRQNKANSENHELAMFPHLHKGGFLKPLQTHKNKPHPKEIDASLSVLTLLSLLTTAVALGMVLFGKVEPVPVGVSGDLYQLKRVLGVFILILSIGILYAFRKSHHTQEPDESNEYNSFSTIQILLYLLVSGIVILFSAEGIIEAISRFSYITHVPYVISGAATALIGCLGEMIVVHNFSVHPNGRIADAVVGVAMDNIVTTIGAAFIAILGGIFLGGDALIVIFVLILFSNTLLIYELSELKSTLIKA
jgi:Ca2+/Na+ antiporter